MTLAPRSLLRPLALLAVVILVGAGCGDDDGDTVETGDTAATTTTVDEAGAAAAVFDRDPCELLTDEQVAEVLGEDATVTSEPGDAEIFQPASCTWSVGTEVDLLDPQLTGITVLLGDRQIFDNMRLLAEDGGNLQELDLGDESFVGDGEGGVLVGPAGITVNPLGVDVNDPATADLIVSLLELVVENA